MTRRNKLLILADEAFKFEHENYGNLTEQLNVTENSPLAQDSSTTEVGVQVPPLDLSTSSGEEREKNPPLRYNPNLRTYSKVRNNPNACNSANAEYQEESPPILTRYSPVTDPKDEGPPLQNDSTTVENFPLQPSSTTLQNEPQVEHLTPVTDPKDEAPALQNDSTTAEKFPLQRSSTTLQNEPQVEHLTPVTDPKDEAPALQNDSTTAENFPLQRSTTTLQNEPQVKHSLLKRLISLQARKRPKRGIGMKTKEPQVKHPLLKRKSKASQVEKRLKPCSLPTENQADKPPLLCSAQTSTDRGTGEEESTVTSDSKGISDNYGDDIQIVYEKLETARKLVRYYMESDYVEGGSGPVVRMSQKVTSIQNNVYPRSFRRSSASRVRPSKGNNHPSNFSAQSTANSGNITHSSTENNNLTATVKSNIHVTEQPLMLGCDCYIKCEPPEDTPEVDQNTSPYLAHSIVENKNEMNNIPSSCSLQRTINGGLTKEGAGTSTSNTLTSNHTINNSTSFPLQNVYGSSQNNLTMAGGTFHTMQGHNASINNTSERMPDIQLRMSSINSLMRGNSGGFHTSMNGGNSDSFYAGMDGGNSGSFHASMNDGNSGTFHAGMNGENSGSFHASMNGFNSGSFHAGRDGGNSGSYHAGRNGGNFGSFHPSLNGGYCDNGNFTTNRQGPHTRDYNNKIDADRFMTGERMFTLDSREVNGESSIRNVESVPSSMARINGGTNYEHPSQIMHLVPRENTYSGANGRFRGNPNDNFEPRMENNTTSMTTQPHAVVNPYRNRHSLKFQRGPQNRNRNAEEIRNRPSKRKNSASGETRKKIRLLECAIRDLKRTKHQGLRKEKSKPGVSKPISEGSTSEDRDDFSDGEANANSDVESQQGETLDPVEERNPPHASLKKTVFTCSHCGRFFINRFNLAEHSHEHDREGHYTCRACELSATTIEKLKNHFLKHHPNDI